MADAALQVKISADVAELKAAFAQARKEIDQTGERAKPLQDKMDSAYATLKVVPDAIVTERIANIRQAYDDLAASGQASTQELARANAEMARQTAQLEAYRDGQSTDAGAAQASANSAADAIRSVSQTLKDEFAKVFAELGNQATQHVGLTAALAAFALSKVKVAALEAGATYLGGFANPAAVATAALLEKVASMAASLARLAAVYQALKFSAGLWGDAMNGTLDQQSTKLLENITQLKTLQGQMQAATLAQAQLLDRTFKASGASDATRNDTVGLRARLQDAPEVGGQFGISTRDLKGKDALGDVELIQKTTTALAEYTEGLDRNNAAKALGISNAEDFLNYGKNIVANTEEQTARLQELSMVYSTEYVAELDAAAAASRRVQQANDDFMNAIRTAWSDATRPIVMEISQFFDGALPTAVEIARQAIAIFFGVFRGGATALVTGMISVEQAILGVGDALAMLGRVAVKVFSGDFAGAAAAFNSGLDAIKNRAVAAGKEIALQWETTNKKLSNIIDGPSRGQKAGGANGDRPVIGRSYTKPTAGEATRAAAGSGASPTDQTKQIADAQYALEKASLEAAQRLQDDSLKQAQKAYDEAYKDGLIALDGYYTARETIERTRLAGIVATREKELQEAKKREAVALKTADVPGQLRAKAEVVKIEAEVQLAKNNLERLAPEIARLKREAQKELDSATLKINIELQQLQGTDTSRAQILATLREQYKDVFTKFAQDPAMTAKLEKIVLLKADTTQFEQDLKKLELAQRQQNDPLAQRAAELKAKVDTGQISGPRAQGQLDALKAQQLVRAQQDLAALEERRAKLNEGDQSEAKMQAALAMDAKISTLKINLESLKPTVVDLGVTFENSLAANAETAFGAMINGTKSAGQAFGDMAKSIIADIAKMIAKMLIMKAIKALTGFADGGAVGGGKSAGDSFAALFAADGGPIRGPGGPRDDVIPAWLSNGEHVMDARTVATFGHGFFNALRAAGNQRGGSQLQSTLGGALAKLGNMTSQAPNPGRFKFADGGPVAALAGAAPGGGGMGMPFVQNFNFAAPTDTRTQSQVAAAAYSGAQRAQARNG